MRISAIVITHNEEANIEECLRSVAWADEIVVVDAMSTDRTFEIAAGFTDRVLRKPWEGYAAARRHAIAAAGSEWILSLDADERVTPELRAEIEAHLAAPDADGYLIPRKAYFLGRWIRHCGWYPGHVIRLFRKDRARVTEKMVHEGIRVDGRVGTLNNHILHYTYRTAEAYFDRFNRYTSLAAKESHLKGKKAGLADILLRPPSQFLKMYIIKLGLLDGLQGFILCVFSACYVFTKYVKLWGLVDGKGILPDEGERSDIR
ncbi:MAG: glycosyltransferase family 2 protein [Candidatus Eisenbacteria bacterium]